MEEYQLDAGILFYLAHRTSACQRTIARTCGFFGVDPGCISVCARSQNLNGCLSNLLKDKTAVFVVSSSEEKRPDCAAPVFRTLRVPLDRLGEPRGIMRLHGAEQTGYLVESVNQAIAILPDDPYEILKMLPAAFERLKTKFSLEGEFPKEERPDYEKLIASSFSPSSDREHGASVPPVQQ